MDLDGMQFLVGRHKGEEREKRDGSESVQCVALFYCGSYYYVGLTCIELS